MVELTYKNSRLLVIILLLLAEVLIYPIGEFPLNDDWAYAKAIETFINSGQVKFSDWQAIPFVTQFIAGISITKLFGFSFTLLRLLSIASLIVIVLVFSAILKEFKIKAVYSFIILLCLVFNPLTLSLSNTFLPDVFTLLLTLAAFLFMIRLTKVVSFKNVLAFVLFSTLATLNRQSGVLLPIAFAIVYFIFQSKNLRNFIVGFAPAIINVACLALFEFIGGRLHKLPANYNLQLNHLLNLIAQPNFETVKSFVYYFITSTILLGLFVLPLTVGNFKIHFQQIIKLRGAKIIALGYFVLLITKIIFSTTVFPFVGNMFYHIGVGPIILTGYNTSEIQVGSALGRIVWIALNFIGGISFILALTSICRKALTSDTKQPNLIFNSALLLCILYMTAICFSYANDRYLLFLLPFLLLLYVTSFDSHVQLKLFSLTFIGIFFFSIITTHDYFSINKARWKATDSLMQQAHISPYNIDGGFEFNAWYCFDLKNYNPEHTYRWWWINDDTYIITPTLIDGYAVVNDIEYISCISFSRKKIHVLKRVGITSQ